MRLKVLGSSSSGNCYLLETKTEALVIEAGISFKEVKKAIGFKVNKLVGVVATHQHGDHSKFIGEFIKGGITALALESTFTTHGIGDGQYFTRTIQDGKGYLLGSFKIIPFPVVHDVPCVGFLIEHHEMGKMVFITDTVLCEYTFDGLNHILIEANYSDEILSKSNTESSRKDRIMQSHMSLATAKLILSANDLSQVRNIVLIHLSDSNSNEISFCEEIQSLTGKQTVAAKKGIEIEVGHSIY